MKTITLDDEAYEPQRVRQFVTADLYRNVGRDEAAAAVRAKLE